MTQNLRPFQTMPARPVPQATAPKDPTAFSELLLAFRRQRLVLLVCMVAGLAVGATHYATSPKKYYAAATILVNERQGDLSGAFSNGSQFVRNDTAVLNEMQVLRSLHLAEGVVTNLDLQDNDAFLSPPSSLAGQLKRRVTGAIKALLPAPPEPESDGAPTEAARITRAAETLRNDIGIERQGLSFSIDISYIATDAALAEGVVNAYAEAYLADQLNANLEASNRSSDWMNGRLEELRESANEAARDVATFRDKNGAMDQQGLREREQRADSLNALYKSLLVRYQEVALEGSYPVTNGRILTLALRPQHPALPKAWQLLSIGLVLGTLFGLGIAVLRELRESGFRTADDVRAATLLPALGYLPKFRKSRLRRRSPTEARHTREHAGVTFASARALPTGRTSPLTLTPTNLVNAATMSDVAREAYAPAFFVSAIAPGSAYSQGLRSIMASLDLNATSDGSRVVAAGSVLGREGATTTIANLANFAARAGHRAVLVDLDIEKPDLSARLKCSRGAGLLDVLDGSVDYRDALRRLPFTGLDLLPCTTTNRPVSGSDPSYLNDIRALIRDLRSRYDYVFLDLPALGATSDAKSLLGGIDHVVLVTEWGTTSRSVLQGYLAHEPELHAKALGVVLNRVILSKLRRYGVKAVPQATNRRAAAI